MQKMQMIGGTKPANPAGSGQNHVKLHYLFLESLNFLSRRCLLVPII